jgi:hypothetical protein
MKYPKIFFLLGILFLVTSCQNPTSNEKPIDKTSSYKVIIEIAGDSREANAYVRDADGNFVLGSVIKVDGITLEKTTSYNDYYANLGQDWNDQKPHSFSIQTPDGHSSSGTIAEPTGTLSGVSYSPATLTAGASSYTASPPQGVWPQGSCVDCLVINNGKYYGYTYNPTGTAPVTCCESTFADASSIKFTSYLLNEVGIDGYTSTSYVSLSGAATSW